MRNSKYLDGQRVRCVHPERSPDGSLCTFENHLEGLFGIVVRDGHYKDSTYKGWCRVRWDRNPDELETDIWDFWLVPAEPLTPHEAAIFDYIRSELHA